MIIRPKIPFSNPKSLKPVLLPTADGEPAVKSHHWCCCWLADCREVSSLFPLSCFSDFKLSIPKSYSNATRKAGHRCCCTYYRPATFCEVKTPGPSTVRPPLTCRVSIDFQCSVVECVASWQFSVRYTFSGFRWSAITTLLLIFVKVKAPSVLVHR